jgi:hypothetical protein
MSELMLKKVTVTLNLRLQELTRETLNARHWVDL